GVAAFDLDSGLCRFVTNFLIPETKRIFLVVLREAAYSVVGEKLLRIPDALEDRFELMLFKDGEDLRVTTRVRITADGEVGTLGDKPFDTASELGMPAQIMVVQHFDGKHGN